MAPSGIAQAFGQLLGGAVALAALAGCDPVWEVRNPATATGTITDACIEAGLRTLDPKLHENHAIDGSRFTYMVVVPSTKQGVDVEWEKAKPTTINLAKRNVGTRPPAGAVEGYRASRGEVVTSIEQACNATVTLGPETCQRCD